MSEQHSAEYVAPESYTVKQIREAFYKHASNDSWGVPCLYESTLLAVLRGEYDPRCNVGGPREATSDCIRPPEHSSEHEDAAGGTWPIAEQSRFRSAEASHE